MSVLDLLFKSKAERERLAHMRDLVLMMTADGKIDDNEMALIASIASREGISESDIKRCISKPGSIKFVAPDTEKKRAMYLMDMVTLMMIDGDINDLERQFCKATAVKLGYKPEVVDALLLGMIGTIKAEMEKRMQ